MPTVMPTPIPTQVPTEASQFQASGLVPTPAPTMTIDAPLVVAVTFAESFTHLEFQYDRAVRLCTNPVRNLLLQACSATGELDNNGPMSFSCSDVFTNAALSSFGRLPRCDFTADRRVLRAHLGGDATVGPQDSVNMQAGVLYAAEMPDDGLHTFIYDAAEAVTATIEAVGGSLATVASLQAQPAAAVEACGSVTFTAAGSTGSFGRALHYTWSFGALTPAAMQDALASALDAAGSGATVTFASGDLYKAFAAAVPAADQAASLQLQVATSNWLGAESTVSALTVQVQPSPDAAVPMPGIFAATAQQVSIVTSKSVDFRVGTTVPLTSDCGGVASVSNLVEEVTWTYRRITAPSTAWLSLGDATATYPNIVNRARAPADLNFDAYAFEARTQHEFKATVKYVDVACASDCPSVVFSLEVQPQQPPTAVLQAPREAGSLCDFSISASGSYDDSAAADAAALTYSWTCNETACNSLVSASTSADIAVTAGALAAGAYSVSVTVTRPSDGVSSVASRDIEVVTDGLPPIRLQASWTKLQRVPTTTAEASITVTVEGGAGCAIPADWTWAWALMEADAPNRLQAAAGLIAVTLADSANLDLAEARERFYPHLVEEQKYAYVLLVFKTMEEQDNATAALPEDLQAVIDYGMFAAATDAFVADGPPSGGAIQVSPVRGEVLMDLFVATTEAWVDADADLEYAFYTCPASGAAATALEHLAKTPAPTPAPTVARCVGCDVNGTCVSLQESPDTTKSSCEADGGVYWSGCEGCDLGYTCLTSNQYPDLTKATCEAEGGNFYQSSGARRLQDLSWEPPALDFVDVNSNLFWATYGCTLHRDWLRDRMASFYLPQGSHMVLVRARDSLGSFSAPRFALGPYVTNPASDVALSEARLKDAMSRALGSNSQMEMLNLLEVAATATTNVTSELQGLMLDVLEKSLEVSPATSQGAGALAQSCSKLVSSVTFSSASLQRMATVMDGAVALAETINPQDGQLVLTALARVATAESAQAAGGRRLQATVDIAGILDRLNIKMLESFSVGQETILLEVVNGKGLQARQLMMATGSDWINITGLSMEMNASSSRRLQNASSCTTMGIALVDHLRTNPYPLAPAPYELTVPKDAHVKAFHGEQCGVQATIAGAMELDILLPESVIDKVGCEDNHCLRFESGCFKPYCLFYDPTPQAWSAIGVEYVGLSSTLAYAATCSTSGDLGRYAIAYEQLSCACPTSELPDMIGLSWSCNSFVPTDTVSHSTVCTGSCLRQPGLRLEATCNDGSFTLPDMTDVVCATDAPTPAPPTAVPTAASTEDNSTPTNTTEAPSGSNDTDTDFTTPAPLEMGETTRAASAGLIVAVMFALVLCCFAPFVLYYARWQWKRELTFKAEEKRRRRGRGDRGQDSQVSQLPAGYPSVAPTGPGDLGPYGMQPGLQPGLQPVLQPGLQPGMQPMQSMQSHRPVSPSMQPSMPPPGMAPAMDPATAAAQMASHAASQAAAAAAQAAAEAAAAAQAAATAAARPSISSHVSLDQGVVIPIDDGQRSSQQSPGVIREFSGRTADSRMATHSHNAGAFTHGGSHFIRAPVPDDAQSRDTSREDAPLSPGMQMRLPRVVSQDYSEEEGEQEVRRPARNFLPTEEDFEEESGPMAHRSAVTDFGLSPNSPGSEAGFQRGRPQLGRGGVYQFQDGARMVSPAGSSLLPLPDEDVAGVGPALGPNRVILGLPDDDDDDIQDMAGGPNRGFPLEDPATRDRLRGVDDFSGRHLGPAVGFSAGDMAPASAMSSRLRGMSDQDIRAHAGMLGMGGAVGYAGGDAGISSMSSRVPSTPGGMGSMPMGTRFLMPPDDQDGDGVGPNRMVAGVGGPVSTPIDSRRSGMSGFPSGPPGGGPNRNVDPRRGVLGTPLGSQTFSGHLGRPAMSIPSGLPPGGMSGGPNRDLPENRSGRFGASAMAHSPGSPGDMAPASPQSTMMPPPAQVRMPPPARTPGRRGIETGSGYLLPPDDDEGDEVEVGPNRVAGGMGLSPAGSPVGSRTGMMLGNEFGTPPGGGRPGGLLPLPDEDQDVGAFSSPNRDLSDLGRAVDSRHNSSFPPEQNSDWYTSPAPNFSPALGAGGDMSPVTMKQSSLLPASQAAYSRGVHHDPTRPAPFAGGDMAPASAKSSLMPPDHRHAIEASFTPPDADEPVDMQLFDDRIADGETGSEGPRGGSRRFGFAPPGRGGIAAPATPEAGGMLQRPYPPTEGDTGPPLSARSSPMPSEDVLQSRRMSFLPPEADDPMNHEGTEEF
eukprot:TRINITY_DN7788_c0_g1_i11.p1 TRINITY_DN7788_c0_g1~~TRINITY_DN7788_c0_g1_i11.p1  ORF type:complete len:2261 (-),score=417.86 TRINITY_DN7788_c0_g1_i11:515-7297(-)